MSEKIPQFKMGDRIQAMQTSENEKLGIDAVCGVVIEKIHDNIYFCYFENGKFMNIHACSLNHVAEITYWNWKKNGVETSKTVEERKLAKVNDSQFVEQVAKAVNCLPSYFVGGNEHIIKSVTKLKAENAELKKQIEEMKKTWTGD